MVIDGGVKILNAVNDRRRHIRAQFEVIVVTFVVNEGVARPDSRASRVTIANKQPRL